MKKYVKSNIADEVEKVLAMLESNKLSSPTSVAQVDGVSQSVMDALKQGAGAFMDLLSL